MRTRLRNGEEFVDLFRRHWIVLAGPLAAALFVLGCFVASFYIRRPYVMPVAGTLLAVTGIWAAWRWLDWKYDLWAVTTHRVIDESGVLAVRTVDSPLDKIHNVMLEQSLIGRMLGYGTIDIQTAAERGETRIDFVDRPEALKEAILESQDRHRGRSTAAHMEPLVRAAAGAAAGGAAGEAMRPGAPAVEGNTKECPHCAETIKAKATICRYCGRPV